jgi:hypothetical protein
MPPACGTAVPETYARCCGQICSQQRGPSSGWKAVTTHPTISGWSHFNDEMLARE